MDKSLDTQSVGSMESQIVLYHIDDKVSLEVKFDAEQETVWLTQQQIADLFGTKRPAITKHLNNIFKSGELDKDSTCSILEHLGNDSKQRYETAYYNLDAILSVGYRVNSINATAGCRTGNALWEGYDCIEGGIANDRVINTVEAYISGTIDVKHALEELSKHSPNNQICIINQQLIDSYLMYKETIRC